MSCRRQLSVSDLRMWRIQTRWNWELRRLIMYVIMMFAVHRSVSQHLSTCQHSYRTPFFSRFNVIRISCGAFFPLLPTNMPSSGVDKRTREGQRARVYRSIPIRIRKSIQPLATTASAQSLVKVSLPVIKEECADKEGSPISSALVCPSFTRSYYHDNTEKVAAQRWALLVCRCAHLMISLLAPTAYYADRLS